MRHLASALLALVVVALVATVHSNGSIGTRGADRHAVHVVQLDADATADVLRHGADAAVVPCGCRNGAPAVEPGSLLPPVAVIRPEAVISVTADPSTERAVADDAFLADSRTLLPRPPQIEVGHSVVSRARRTADLQVYRL